MSNEPLDMERITRIAKELGIEVVESNQGGLYYIDEEGNKQKWDAIEELGLERRKQ